MNEKEFDETVNKLVTVATKMFEENLRLKKRIEELENIGKR